jgi:hypothetical protein
VSYFLLHVIKLALDFVIRISIEIFLHVSTSVPFFFVLFLVWFVSFNNNDFQYIVHLRKSVKWGLVRHRVNCVYENEELFQKFPIFFLYINNPVKVLYLLPFGYRYNVANDSFLVIGLLKVEISYPAGNIA